MADAGVAAHPTIAEPALYSAFISYSHHDRALATRLQRRIERYRLPRHLRRKGAPARLKPVCRDRDELTAAPDLSEALQAALRQSGYLIAVCTPAAAQSEWVGREIAYFREAHGDRNVLAALFAGEPGDAFHPALLAGPHGVVAHPLAADFRPGGDGGRLALLKLIAPMAGVRLDELVQRDAQRRMRQIVILALAGMATVIVAAALVIATMQARAAAEQERLRSADAMHFQLTDLRSKLEAAGRLDLLVAVNKGVERYYAGQDLRTLSIPALLQRAELLQADAKDDEKRGELRAARGHAAEAWRITGPLLTAYPNDPKVIYTHAQSEYYVGYVDWRLGDAAAAETRWERYARLADRLTRIDPNNPDWLREKGYADSNLGMLALRQGGDLIRARQSFTAAQGAFLAFAHTKPDDPDIRSDIADGEGWLADIDRLAGNLSNALTHRERQQRIIAGSVARAPRDARLRVNLVASEIGLARVTAAQRRYTEALAQFDDARRMAEELATADPDNNSIARQKRAIEVLVAQTWLSMPRTAQPAANRIAQMLGDCDAEWRKPRNDELAALCTLELARLRLAGGDRDGAARALIIMSKRKIATTPGLSERLRIDVSRQFRDALRSTQTSSPSMR